MEPFHIICKTCASRLKVRSESLIGQTLACPKCGGMVKVPAPEGWVDKSLQSADEPAVDPGNFDDIETLIQNEQRKPSQASALPQPSPTPAAKPKPVQTKPTTEQATQSHDPMLPNQAWTSSESQKRKKLTMILAGSLAGLLLAIAAITAFVVNSGNKEDGNGEEVAQNDNDIVSDSEEPDDTNPADPAEETNNSDANNNNAANTEDNNNPETPRPTTHNDPVETETNPTTIEPSPTDPSEKPSGEQTPLMPPVNEPDKPNPEQEDDLFGLNLENLGQPTIDDPILGNPLGGASIPSRMGELNSLLSDNGTTLGEIGGIADAHRQSELLGVPKYFIEKIPSKPKNVIQYLSNDIAGLQYQGGVSLVDFTRDIGAIIGAPVAIHVESLRAADLELDPELNLQLTDLKLSEAVDVALAEIGMVQVQTESGIIVLAKGWEVPSQRRFAAPQMSDRTANGLASFVRRIRGMFPKEIWTEETAIEFQGNELVVTQLPQVTDQIKKLFGKMTAAQTLNANPNDEAAKSTLQSSWASSAAARATKTEFKRGPSVPIERFVQKIEKQADVRILIEWNSLANDGWTPIVKIPGQFQEQTVEESLDQLARGMGVTYRAVGERTFELLTFQEAAIRPELQIYSANTIINETFKSEDLMEILRSALQVDEQLVQVGFVEDIQGVVVIAPQSIQRQFEAVMNRLRQPKE